MALTAYKKTGLTGGSIDDLDGIDGDSLVDGDFSYTMTSGGVSYVHELDATSGASESSPDVIAPDSNPGAKRWLLKTGYYIETPPGLVLLATVTASNDASVAFDSLIDDTYDVYQLHVVNALPATDAAFFLFRTSTNGGSSYDSGASDYKWLASNMYGAGNRDDNGDAADTSVKLNTSNGVGNDTGQTGQSGVLYLYAPSVAAYTHVMGNFVWTDGANHLCHEVVSGARLSATDVDAVQFLFSAGNITSGEFKLYGVKKSL